MTVKNLEDAIKLQKEFIVNLGRTMDVLRKDKAPDLTEMVRQHEESISRTQTTLESAKKQREAMLRRWDQRIERHKENLSRQKKELDEFKKKLKAHEDKLGRNDRKKLSPRKK